MSRIDATEVLQKKTADVIDFGLDFVNQLESGESLTGTPTITLETGSGITVDSKAIIGTQVTGIYSGGVVRSKPWCVVVTASLSGGVSGATLRRSFQIQVVPDC